MSGPLTPDTSIRRKWPVCSALVLITLLVYSPVLRCLFINYDDGDYVFNNPAVQAGLTTPGFLWALRTGHTGNWHPLTWLSHMMDCQLFGMNPAGHHLTNLLIHCANASLLFLLLLRMTGAFWPSAFVAALFAWHPLRVESVAWVAERKDVLSTFFMLLAVWAYTKYVQLASPNPKTIAKGPLASSSYYFALLFYVLSLMSKPMYVTLPFILLLLDWWPLCRINALANPDGAASLTLSNVKRLAVEKLPFLVLSLASCIVTYRVQNAAGAVSSLEALPLTSRLANIPVSYVRYISKIIWPSSLAIFYPFPKHWPLWIVAVSIALLVLILVLMLRTAARRPYLATGWLFFLGTLIPVIGLVHVGTQSIADRYTYMPSVGIFIAVVWLAREITRYSASAQKTLCVLGVIILAACLVVTYRQLAYWRDTETIFARAVKVTKDNYLAHLNLGTYLESTGRDREALDHLNEALRIAPESPELLNNLGVIAFNHGQTNDALSYLTRSLKSAPNYAEAQNNLGNVLAALGDFDGASNHYTTALKCRKYYAEAHNNLGRVLEIKGNLPEAIRQYQAALEINPGYADTHVNFGKALLRQGNTSEAASHFADALHKKPSDVDVIAEVARVLAGQNKIDAAVDYLSRALQSNPNNPDLHGNLGNCYAMRGDYDKAESEYLIALKLKPDFAEAYFNLGNVLNLRGKPGEATRNYNEAIKLKPDYIDARMNFAELLTQQGDLSGARIQYLEVLRLRPRNSEASRRLNSLPSPSPKAR